MKFVSLNMKIIFTEYENVFVEYENVFVEYENNFQLNMKMSSLNMKISSLNIATYGQPYFAGFNLMIIFHFYEIESGNIFLAYSRYKQHKICIKKKTH